MAFKIVYYIINILVFNSDSDGRLNLPPLFYISSIQWIKEINKIYYVIDDWNNNIHLNILFPNFKIIPPVIVPEANQKSFYHNSLDFPTADSTFLAPDFYYYNKSSSCFDLIKMLDDWRFNFLPSCLSIN